MNIKKILKVSFASLVIASGVVNAMDDIKPYVGAEVAYGKWSYGTELKNTAANLNQGMKKSNPSFGLMLGSKFHENFGAEIGYTMLRKTKVFTSGNNFAEVKANNLYLDAMGYAPVADSFNLLGSLGFGRMRVKLNDQTGSFKKSKVGLRVGVGAQYNFSDCLAARLMLRHQGANAKPSRAGADYGVTKNLRSIALGLTYSFM